jgi:hypothetical protein
MTELWWKYSVMCLRTTVYRHRQRRRRGTTLTVPHSRGHSLSMASIAPTAMNRITARPNVRPGTQARADMNTPLALASK